MQGIDRPERERYVPVFLFGSESRKAFPGPMDFAVWIAGDRREGFPNVLQDAEQAEQRADC